MHDRLREFGSLGAAIGLTCLLAGAGLASTTDPTYPRVYQPTPTRAPTPTRFPVRTVVATLPPGQTRYRSLAEAQAAVPFRILRPATWREGPLLSVFVTRTPAGAVTLVEQRYAVPAPDGLDLPLGVAILQAPPASPAAPLPLDGQTESVSLRGHDGVVRAGLVTTLKGERRLTWSVDGTHLAVAAPDLLEPGWFAGLARDLAE